MDWIGFTNPGRTRLRAFLGVLDWPVPPLVPCVPNECLNEAPMQILEKLSNYMKNCILKLMKKGKQTGT